jgi:riboflavin kinase/FMN adenylyltransferase
MEYKTTLLENEPIAITIGNFDGIHLGHQRLMCELRAMAQALHCKPVLVTFSPHTLMVVRPEIYVRYLTTLEEKLTLTKQYGDVADNIVIHFTPDVASMNAEDFMDSLHKHFSIQGLVIGANFSLGRNRMGDSTFLARYAQARQIQFRAISLEEIADKRISSTRIRTLVNEGNIAAANELLGHPVIMSGIVKHGDARGRLIGFPTANLIPDPHKLLPADGVYAVRVSIQSESNSDAHVVSTVYNGVANIGIRPTFGLKERIVEAHLLDVDLDLYGKYMTLEFLSHLRNEQRFSGIDTLKAQIATDVQNARQILTIGG